MNRVCMLILAGVAVWMAGAGCRSGRPPMKMEAPQVSAEYAGGSPLHERPVTLQAGQESGVEMVDIEAYALATAPRSALQPFGGQSTLITGTGDSSILAISEELSAARLGTGEDVSTFVQQVNAGVLGAYAGPTALQGAIAVGTTLRIQSGEQSTMSVVIGHDRPDLLRVGLAMRESQLMALSDVPHVPGKQRPLAVVVPAKDGGSIAYVMKVRPAKDTDEAAKARQLLKPSSQATRPVRTVEQLLVQQTLQTAMENRSARRSALVYMASQSRASICEDAALSADDGFLQLLVDEIAKRMNEPARSVDMPAVGWTLDSAAFDLLGRLQLQKKLSPRLTAVLLIHAGEVGRSGSSLEQLVGKAVSRKDLENRLIAENFLYLEDVSPAARIRAYDWLTRKGRTPAGYDPLAPAAQRKKAIDAAIEEMAKESTEMSK